MFSLICARINDWVNNGEAGDLRRIRDHYDVIVMGLNDLNYVKMSKNMYIVRVLLYFGVVL